MLIAVGCDHRGLKLKQAILNLLQELGYTYRDFGCYDSNPIDFPDIAQVVGQAIAEKQFDQGILICSTGVGMSIAANKVSGIRAALCHDTFSAHRAREHNDANILCLGQDVVGRQLALEVVKTYLSASFLGGRHSRRLDKIRALEGARLDNKQAL